MSALSLERFAWMYVIPSASLCCSAIYCLHVGSLQRGSLKAINQLFSLMHRRRIGKSAYKYIIVQ